MKSSWRWDKPLPALRPFSVRALQALLPTAPQFAGREVVHIKSADDPLTAIYRTKTRRDHGEYQRQVRKLSAQALGQHFARFEPALQRLECPVCVHYSWGCLKRLLEAREIGRSVLVDSVLVPTCVEDSLLQIAFAAAPTVLMAEVELIQDEFSSEGSSQEGSVNYVVAHPVSTPLQELRPPFLVLDGLGAAQNIGQILRTAYHLGITSVVASRSVWNSLSGRCCRVSMGWLYHMDFHLADPLADALKEMKDLGVRVYVAEDHFKKAVQPHPVGKRNWALIVGHEDNGASAESLALADERVCVPQRQGESLNVAHAAAICLYELSRHMD